MLSLLPLMLHLTLAGSGEMSVCVRVCVCAGRYVVDIHHFLAIDSLLHVLILPVLFSVSPPFHHPSPSLFPPSSMTHAQPAVTASTRGSCHQNTRRPPLPPVQVVRTWPNRAAAVCKEGITAAAAPLALARNPLQFLIHL